MYYEKSDTGQSSTCGTRRALFKLVGSLGVAFFGAKDNIHRVSMV